MSLAGRVALVTGGSRGIGHAISLRLARDGAAVAVNYANNADAAERTVWEIEANGGRVIAVRADVGSAADVEALFATIERELGAVTILVNNAALTDTHKPWYEIDEAEWDRVLDVNLKSCFLTFRRAYAGMRDAGWGRVINISSVTYWLGQANLLHYVSSKAGMIGFTRTLSREVGVDGITVNAVTPGAIQTESELELFPEQEHLALRMNELQGIKRRGVPVDIAGAVSFLASEDSTFITGQTINVDGGWAMH